MYISNLGRVDAIVANTHLGDQTTVDVIKQGNNEIQAVAQKLNIPVDYMAVDENMREIIKAEEFNLPIKFIHRYMPQALW